MRNKKAVFAVFSLLIAMIMIMCTSVATTAAEEPTGFEPEIPTQAPTDPPTDPPTDAPTDAVTDAPTQEVTQAPTNAQVVETQAPQQSNDKKDTLPKVNIGDVVVPDTLDIPKAEISDTSLMAGVISWLCVAVGIAVLAGVLVSQRAKQVSNPRDSRRR